MKKIDIFCGLNSLGLALTRDNRKQVNYSQLVAKALRQQGYQVCEFNFSRINRNCSWHLEIDLYANTDLDTLGHKQQESVDQVRQKNLLFRHFVQPIKRPITGRQGIRELIRSSEYPLFIYSVGPNNIFSFIHAGPIDLLFPAKRSKLDQAEYIIKKAIRSHVESDWQKLHEISPKIKILALSWFDCPVFHKIQRLIKLQSLLGYKANHMTLTEMVAIYNYHLDQSAKKYDFVQLIDISDVDKLCPSLDFHPNRQGHELIAHKILEKI